MKSQHPSCTKQSSPRNGRTLTFEHELSWDTVLWGRGEISSFSLNPCSPLGARVCNRSLCTGPILFLQRHPLTAPKQIPNFPLTLPKSRAGGNPPMPPTHSNCPGQIPATSRFILATSWAHESWSIYWMSPLSWATLTWNSEVSQIGIHYFLIDLPQTCFPQLPYFCQ